MQGHIRRRELRIVGVHDRRRQGAGATLPGLRQEVLGRAASQGELSWLRRRARSGRGASPRDQGRLRHGREAQAAMSKVAVAVEEQTHVAASRLTVRDYLTKEWLPAIEHTIRPTTYHSYVAHVECHILPALGSVQLQKLAPAQINALYAKLDRRWPAQRQGPLTPLTVRHVHAVLHRALKDAVRWGRLARNPADLADPPRVAAHGHELRTWSAEQLAAFLDSRRDDRLYALWHTLAMTGLRRGEALGLRWEDVDLKRHGSACGVLWSPKAARSPFTNPRPPADGAWSPWILRPSGCFKARPLASSPNRPGPTAGTTQDWCSRTRTVRRCIPGSSAAAFAGL